MPFPRFLLLKFSHLFVQKVEIVIFQFLVPQELVLNGKANTRVWVSVDAWTVITETTTDKIMSFVTF